MDAPPPDFRLLSVKMGQVPPRQRVDFWRDLLARKLFAVDVQPLNEGTFHVEASLRMLPELTVGWGTIDASINRRTPRLIAADNDDFFLTVNLDGTFGAEQNGHEVSLGAGDGYFMTCTELGSFHRAQPGRILCVRLPGASLAARVAHPYDSIGKPIMRNNEALALLVTYARTLGENQPLQSSELREIVTRHMQDLVAVALSPSRETLALGLGGLRAARLVAIKGYICAHLARHDLDVGAVAAQHRLSPRQLQRLFEGDGTTFSEFVLEKRLAAARRALADPASRHRTIADIAFDSGFGDVSHFNRVFRRRFAASPSEVRNFDIVAGARGRRRAS